MNVLETLEKKTEELKSLADNDRDIILLEEEKRIIEDCLNALKDDNLLYDYDFASIFNILNNENINIDDLEKRIQDLKQAIDIKREVFNMQLSDSQVETKTLLSNSLNDLNTDVDKRIETKKENNKLKEEADKLESMRDVLQNTGKKKYYTDEMFDSFYNVYDWENMSDEEFDQIVNLFDNTRNFQGKIKKEKEDINNVISLYKEYLSEEKMNVIPGDVRSGKFLHLIEDNDKEVCQNIDLDNAREILSFLKEKNELDNFDIQALLMISVFADSDFVKKLYESKVNEYGTLPEMYYGVKAASLWVVEESDVKRAPFRVTKKNKTNHKTLYSKCHVISDLEFQKNRELLTKYKNMFVEKYDVSLTGSHMSTLMSDTTVLDKELKAIESLNGLLNSRNWSLRKNLELLRVFHIGDVYKIPISTIGKGDLENKIHLAIELGLLNPPLNDYFRMIDEDITTNEQFLKLNSQENIRNNTIRNYFARKTSILSSLDINSYGFLFYRLNQLGYTDFYNYFFSDNKTGERADSEINDDMKKSMPNKDEFINKNFITEFYNNYVTNYNQYDIDISNYNEENKKQEMAALYYNEEILEDDLIKELEENNRITDRVEYMGMEAQTPNEFLYKFDNTLVSRLKVLKNASILKEKYGYLDRNMLLSSIVRNSFLTMDSFEKIKESLEERNVLL